MIALDTNVVVRFLVNDDPRQAQRARKLIEMESVLVTPTVLLETEWVLRAAYKFEPGTIAGFLHSFLGLQQVSTSEAPAVSQALRWYERGLDFADALHLALAGDASAFASFDIKFARRARRLQSRVIVAP